MGFVTTVEAGHSYSVAFAASMNFALLPAAYSRTLRKITRCAVLETTRSQDKLDLYKKQEGVFVSLAMIK